MKEWILKNWGNVFSVLGLITGIYLGVFYVPSHVKEALTEKQNTIHNDLIQATKELVYSDSITTIEEINTLIKGKEVKYRVNYTYTTNQLLLQTQESFMEHKFLPLTKRKELIAEIAEIKAILNEDSAQEDVVNNSAQKIETIIFLISTVFSIIVVGAGLLSIISRFRREKAKTEEINNQIDIQTDIDYLSNRKSAEEYENLIVKVINDKLNVIGNLSHEKIDKGIDYKFVYKGVKNYVYIKYLTKNNVGLASIQTFFNALVGRKGNAILVYNTGLTTMVNKEIEKFKIRNPEINLVLIKAKNEREFTNKFNAKNLISISD